MTALCGSERVSSVFPFLNICARILQTGYSTNFSNIGSIHISPYLCVGCLLTVAAAKCAGAPSCLYNILWHCSRKTSSSNPRIWCRKNRKYLRPLSFLGIICGTMRRSSSTVSATNLPCDVLTQGKLALKRMNTAARAVA